MYIRLHVYSRHSVLALYDSSTRLCVTVASSDVCGAWPAAPDSGVSLTYL